MPPTTTTIYRYKKTGAIPTPEELERLANDIHRASGSLAYAEQQLERVEREATQRRHEVEACQEQHDRAQRFLLDRLAGWERVEIPTPAPADLADALAGREVGWAQEASQAQEARQEATGRLLRGEREPS